MLDRIVQAHKEYRTLRDGECLFDFSYDTIFVHSDFFLDNFKDYSSEPTEHNDYELTAEYDGNIFRTWVAKLPNKEKTNE